MGKFLALLFVVSFIVGWFAVEPAAAHIRAGEATGFALLFTGIGWLVAAKVSVRWGAGVAAALLVVAWIGR